MKKYNLFKPVSIAPLIVFRIGFGLLALFSVIRFLLKGWVNELYIIPTYHFTYYGFAFIKPLPAWVMYTAFAVMALVAIGITVGFLYRVSAVLFFLLFTYIELIDKAYYLNHYYFVSLIALLLACLPAGRFFSLDNKIFNKEPVKCVPRVSIDIIKFQLFVVYFYAGLAKLNADWLLEALPLRIWLHAFIATPVVGFLMGKLWVAYAFSWFGAIYDITIPFLLLYKKTRVFAYITVIIFHVITWMLFPIGVFPWVMIVSTLIFFSDAFHQRVLELLSKLFKINLNTGANTYICEPESRERIRRTQLFTGIVILYCLFQLLFPWRFTLYPDKLYWTEQGYRFSWRVMLMEKAGTAFFHVKNAATGKESEISNSDYLTRMQEKMMSTQPDMILQFAHYLAEEYKKKGYVEPSVRVECYVTLNGEGSRLFIDPSYDLAKESEGFGRKSWILPYRHNTNK